MKLFVKFANQNDIESLNDSEIIEICDQYVIKEIEIDENEDPNFDFCLTDSDTIFDYSKLNDNTKLIKKYYPGDDNKCFMPAVYYEII